MPLSYTEAELIISLKSKDQDAFSYLFDHYAPALNGVVLRSVTDKRISEIFLKKIFKKIWEMMPGFDSAKETLFSWMMSITKSLLREYAKPRPVVKEADANIMSLAYFDGYTKEELALLTNQPANLLTENLRRYICTLRRS